MDTLAAITATLEAHPWVHDVQVRTNTEWEVHVVTCYVRGCWCETFWSFDDERRTTPSNARRLILEWLFDMETRAEGNHGRTHSV